MRVRTGIRMVHGTIVARRIKKQSLHQTPCLVPKMVPKRPSQMVSKPTAHPRKQVLPMWRYGIFTKRSPRHAGSVRAVPETKQNTCNRTKPFSEGVKNVHHRSKPSLPAAAPNGWEPGPKLSNIIRSLLARILFLVALLVFMVFIVFALCMQQFREKSENLNLKFWSPESNRREFPLLPLGKYKLSSLKP